MNRFDAFNAFNWFLFIINISYTLRPWQNGRNFADDIFKCVFVNENVWFPIKISLKFVLKGLINEYSIIGSDNGLALPVSLLAHICVTRPQWVQPEQNNRHFQTMFCNVCLKLKFVFYLDQTLVRGFTWVQFLINWFSLWHWLNAEPAII